MHNTALAPRASTPPPTPGATVNRLNCGLFATSDLPSSSGDPDPLPPAHRAKLWLRLFNSTAAPPTPPPSGGSGDGDGDDEDQHATLEQFLAHSSMAVAVAARIPPEDLSLDQLADLLAITRTLQNFIGLLKNV